MNTSDHADTIIIGGGTAGAAMAGRLAARGDESVLLLEAGPDYGALADNHWPEDLLDARVVAESHDWGYANTGASGANRHPLQRARVLGGCSAHNGCIELWGHRDDYDNWASLLGGNVQNSGWSTDELLPFFHKAAHKLRVRDFTEEEITPFHQACIDTIAAQPGIPRVDDLNNLDEASGVNTAPVNIYDDLRWNTALAYLDPLRDSKSLTTIGDCLVEKLAISNHQVKTVDVITPDGTKSFSAERIIICAGSYGSPTILLRSGIGPAQDLEKLGIGTALDLPGVGQNLHDHPAIYLQYSGSEKLDKSLQDFIAAGNTLFTEQSLAKLRSSHCNKAFDLHIYPVTSATPNQDGRWECVLPVANMAPLSRGRLRLKSRDAREPPDIDTAYLSDESNLDLAVLMDGVEIARTIAGQTPLAELIGEEKSETSKIRTGEDVRRHCLHYYHPAGTCKMGLASDPFAVIDNKGKVHGLDNLYVADASIMPVIPRANTNMPTLVVAEYIAERLSVSKSHFG